MIQVCSTYDSHCHGNCETLQLLKECCKDSQLSAVIYYLLHMEWSLQGDRKAEKVTGEIFLVNFAVKQKILYS